jgi:hypothetical protein
MSTETREQEPEPDESHVCVMNSAAFGAYCGDVVGWFHSNLLSGGNFVFRADAHKLPIVHPRLQVGEFGVWKISEHAHACFLCRFLVDTRAQLWQELEDSREAILEELKKARARWLGGARIYVSMNMDRMLFDVGIVIPFWGEEKEKVKPKPKLRKKGQKRGRK